MKLGIKKFNKEKKDKGAILKRSCVIANTESRMYWRVPGEDKRRVPFIEFPSADGAVINDFIVDSAKPKIKAYKQGCRDFPADYDQAAAWEQDWFKEAMRKQEEREKEKKDKKLNTPVIAVPQPALAASSSAPSKSLREVFAEQSAKEFQTRKLLSRMKKEQRDDMAAQAKALSKKSAKKVIDADAHSPPPKRIKVEPVDQGSKFVRSCSLISHDRFSWLPCCLVPESGS